MGYGMNIFDYIEDGAVQGEQARWSARSPFRPREDFDLMLVPRTPDWRQDEDSRAALERIEAEPWVEAIAERGDEVLLRLASSWVEERGGRLESGEGIAGANADLAEGRSYAVYFWGANTTKALHIGHLRNLAVGHALGAALEQAGARVERRSLICDVGRSMGEAMAGVVHSGRDQQVWPEGEEKSDHFVGACYADYVTAGRAAGVVGGDGADDGAEDSVARESSMYNDKADELMLRVLRGDQEALELWSKTRAWVISGQRKTLSRLGIAFDKVIFESDFLPEVLELTNLGLSEGKLTKRYGDDMVMYETEREELEEMPLVRSDGLPTQHMRALAYWSAAPELDDFISLQVCGNEWVSHVTCRRQLIDELGVVNGNGSGSAKGGGPPTHDVFHGMVARDRTSITSSKEGALLIDDLADWLGREIEADPERADVWRAHAEADRLPSRIALAYFLLQPTSKRVDFEPEKLLREGKGSLGWDLARAQAHRGTAPLGAERAAEDADYRFAVVQSELYRRHLRSSVEGLDVLPLARYVSHFARWYREDERSPEVERVARTLLEHGVRGLGLEGA
ncbi:MAG: Arginyl-tRNA synthetase-like protein [Solirubrobacterales bacterium]|nr:Arginyl-tRNA synthetase-like protein [Solirubrobacterales bacterium]